MADIIIVLILIVIAVFAIKQTKKHMHGESPCCGGGSGTVKKVKEKHLDGPVMGTKTMKIKGMTCEHCVNNVTNAQYAIINNNMIMLTGFIIVPPLYHIFFI